MTHGLKNGNTGGFGAVPVSPKNGDYVKLRDDDDIVGVEFCASSSRSSSSSSSSPVSSTSSSCYNGFWCSLWWWAKLVLLTVFLVVLSAVFLKWIGPFFMDKEIIPVINWETRTFSTPVLGLIIFASVSLFPVILLPSSPSMWVAGMTFGYWYGFLIILVAVIIGVSLPYFIGSVFNRQIQAVLERYPKKASVIRLAGEGDFFNQCRAVALIRISPFPYIIYNYCAVATDVKYFPYLMGSILGMIPEIFLTLYTGVLIKTLADASQDHHMLTVEQIILNVIGFCVTTATTVLVTVYAKRRLKELQEQEEQLLLPQ